MSIAKVPHDNKLIVKGARVHNLKNLTVEMPRDAMVVFTGLSGSGKSSLAFDTIFAEGQRRYVESLSAYARQFLGQVDRPDVDFIEGLSPAVSIDQKSTNRNPRSTVGTITEIHDYLRLLWARIGVPHCPECGEKIVKQTPQAIVDQLLALPEGTRFQVLAPIVDQKKGEFVDLFKELVAQGYARAQVDGEVIQLADATPLKKSFKHDISVVVDRLVAKSDIVQRLTDSVETALKLAGGRIVIDFIDTKETRVFSEKLSCPNEHPLTLTEIEPRTFSFNAPFGACPTCSGLGTKMSVDADLVIGDESASINEGAILPWSTQGKGLFNYFQRMLEGLADDFGFDLDTPWSQLGDDAKEAILYGNNFDVKVRYKNKYGRELRYTSGFEGVLAYIERKWLESEQDYARQRWAGFLREVPCPACNGARLKPEVLAVKVDGESIAAVASMSLGECVQFFEKITLDERDAKIASQVLREIRARLDFLMAVGLDYLSLERSAGSLSGGEAQRIRLATQIGSGLTGVLYVLDEPSIGLHQRDNRRLIDTLIKLRDLGNTLLVVEHDEDTIRASDWVVDIGPGAGVNGGEVVHSAPYEELLKNERSITGAFLSGREKIETPNKRRKIDPARKLKIVGAKENNLKGVDVEVPLGVFTAVTGVSGSGKSSLINDVLYNVLANALNGAKLVAGRHTRIEGLDLLDKVVHVDQAPIGRTPRSNPATYTGVFDVIRKLFADTQESKARGYQQGRFSFNVKGGRCEACSGDGTLKIEMNFLPDVYVLCEVCHGQRYNRETLQVRYKGKNIAEVLEMPIAEAAEFFAAISSISRYLNTLVDVGLGYVRLGQSATTLSGGEAQRVKLATELQKRSYGRSIYVLDEPTTGLHFEDTRKLLMVLNSLVEKGNSVLVIEHNLDVIKSADWIIDLGPEGGSRGGEIIATGTPRNSSQEPEELYRSIPERTFGLMAEELGFRPKTSEIPTNPGVYRFLDAKGRVLYVGKAKNLRARLTNYFGPLDSLHERTRRMVTSAADVKWVIVKTEFEALQLEFMWIKQFDPPFNVRFKDDKSYPYLAISLGEEVPRAFITRNRDLNGVRYFGPYTQAWAVRETLDTLLKVYPVRSCSNGIYLRAKREHRACLLADIGKCSAPCISRVSQQEHKTIAKQFIEFMAGSDSKHVASLRKRMLEASENQQYELAAQLRDDVAALETVLEKSTIVFTDQTDADLFAIAEDELAAAVSQFIVRGGRIRGVRGWVVDKELERTLPEMVEYVLQHNYAPLAKGEPIEVPKEVLVPELPADSKALNEWLNGLRGSKVDLRVAQRGDKAALAKTALTNAKHSLMLYKTRRTSDFTARADALAELQNALQLETAPLRIECYDISHLGGTDVVGSMVVFEDGLPKKAHYRRFAIAETTDDTDSIYQVLTRRLKYLTGDKDESSDETKFSYRPGLLLIDGGQPQVNAAARALRDAKITDIAVVGIAKRLEELWLPGSDFPVILPRASEGLFLVQRLRDEAHRFAIEFQRKKRSGSIASALIEIPGLGDKRVNALLKHFGSVKRLKIATVDEISEVAGIGLVLAQQIRETIGE